MKLGNVGSKTSGFGKKSIFSKGNLLEISKLLPPMKRDKKNSKKDSTVIQSHSLTKPLIKKHVFGQNLKLELTS